MTELLQTQAPFTIHNQFHNLEELYNRYGKQAFGLALRILEDPTAAEQAIQEVFLRYWRQPGQYQPQSGTFLNWLLREVHCYCLDRLPVNPNPQNNTQFNRGLGPLSTEILLAGQVHIPETGSEQNLNSRRQLLTQQALKELPQEQREIVEMAYFKGLNTLQIAQLTGQPAQVVKQKLTLGLVGLKKALAQYSRV